MDEKINHKKGQVVIWVIGAIALLALIGIAFMASNTPKGGKKEIDYDPQSFIRQCVSNELANLADELLVKGGFENPEGYLVYNNATISYLCKNEGYFKPCINQHPMFVNEISDGIKNNMEEKIEECFIQLAENLKARNIQISEKPLTFSVEMAPRKILINMKKEMRLDGRESSQIISDWSVQLNHPIYNLASVAIEIANQESVYCYFEYVGFMILYPDFVIRKNTLTEGTKIYTIEDVKTKKEMNVAIRGCVIPPGI